MAEYTLELYVRDEFSITEPDGRTVAVRLAIPFIRDNGRHILIDYGNQETVYSQGTLPFCGTAYRISPTARTARLRTFSKLLHTSIDVILGMDIIKQYTVVLDYRAGRCRFEKALPAEFQKERCLKLLAPANVFPVGSQTRELPLIAAKVGGRKAVVGLDTGASVAYMRNVFRNGAPTLGRAPDFNVLEQSYITEVFRQEVCFGDERFTELIGVSKSELETFFQYMHFDGLLGFDFFNTYTTALDYRNGRLYYKRAE